MALLRKIRALSNATISTGLAQTSSASSTAPTRARSSTAQNAQDLEKLARELRPVLAQLDRRGVK